MVFTVAVYNLCGSVFRFIYNVVCVGCAQLSSSLIK